MINIFCVKYDLLLVLRNQFFEHIREQKNDRDRHALGVAGRRNQNRTLFNALQKIFLPSDPSANFQEEYFSSW